MMDGSCELLLLGGINSIDIVNSLFKYENKQNKDKKQVLVFNNIIELLGKQQKTENLVYHSHLPMQTEQLVDFFMNPQLGQIQMTHLIFYHPIDQQAQYKNIVELLSAHNYQHIYDFPITLN